MTDLRADLKADLLADLAPPEIEEAPPLTAAPLPPELSDATPALSFQCTPLRWSRPRVVKAKAGAGKAVKVGPLKIELSVRD